MVKMAPNELWRGCGARRVGKLYLMGEGMAQVCPTLPLPLGPCDCCGYEPKQYRDFMFVPKSYFQGLKIKHPTGEACDPRCPVCYPSQNFQDKYGLMWVGKKYYTPKAFIEEADKHEVSKAIKQIPAGVVLGETWIMLAHPQGFVDIEAPDFQEKWAHWNNRGRPKDEAEPLPRAYPAVFYAFIPNRIETLLYESDATPEKVQALEARGITVIVIPDDADDHKAHKSRGGRGGRRL